MARRKKKEPSFTDLLLQFTVGCVFFLAFNLVFIRQGWLTGLLIFVIILSTAGLIARIVYVQEKLRKANINEIDKMSGEMFERYLEQFFRRQGWKVEHIGGKGDYGADLILSAPTKKVVVQAKRWQKNVGYEAIQQAHSSKGIYECNEAWVITNSRFTEQAMNGAKKLDVRLWDRDVLIEQMSKINAAQTIKVNEREPIEVKPTPTINVLHKSDADLFVCAKCGKPVTNKTKEYCLSNPRRFNGRIYCYEHQR